MNQRAPSIEALALTLCFIIAAISLATPQVLTDYIQPSISTILSTLGAPFFSLVSILLFAVIIIAVCPFGKRTMGGEGAQVEFSTLGWLSMLFAAGMGSGLVFWGVAEPALHSLNPPLKTSLFDDKLASSLAITLVNWGAHAWALYAVFGLVLGGLTSKQTQSGDISAPVVSALANNGTSVRRYWVKRIVKLIAVIAIFFGVVGTIANSTLLMSKGIELELDIHNKQRIAAVILVVLCGLYTLSAKVGLKRGVQSLSIFNVALCFVMLFWLMCIVPVKPILDIAINGTVYYLEVVLTSPWSFEDQLANRDWATGWTYNYYFWWLAWGPFVGVFLAKISSGRPVWQYILGVVLVPTLVTILWFATFSGAAIAWDQAHNAGILQAISTDYTQGLFAFFSELGWQGQVFIWLSLTLLLVFVATSADSAVLVIRELVSSSHKLSLYAWCLALILCSWGLLMQHNEPLNRTIAILGALPFLAVFILQLFGFVKELIKEKKESG